LPKGRARSASEQQIGAAVKDWSGGNAAMMAVGGLACNELVEKV